MMQDANSYFKRAEEKFHNKDFEGGLTDLDNAIRLNPSNSDYYWARGIQYYLHKEFQLALLDFNKSLELADDLSNKARAYRKRATCLYFLKEYEKMIFDANWLIDNGFPDDMLYQFRGSSKARLNDLEGAIQDYTMSQQLTPHENTLLKRAAVYNQLQRYKDVIDDLTVVINSNKIQLDLLPGIHCERGIAYYKLNDHDKALADFNQMQRLQGQSLFSSATQFMDIVNNALDHA